jgi:hypothetical protein
MLPQRRWRAFYHVYWRWLAFANRLRNWRKGR